MEDAPSAFRCLLEREALGREQSDYKFLCSDQVEEHCSLNIVWREKVVQWCYDVVDHLNEDRSIVYVAMNILDRFCAATAMTNPIDERMYEVASLASVFLAIRLSGTGELLLNDLVSMSRGGITLHDIVSTGTSIIGALSWECSILTPIDFVQSIFQLVPCLSKSPKKQLVLESASYLIELAVCDSFFSKFKASSLALAAILCALQANQCTELTTYKECVCKVTEISLESNETFVLCSRLQSIYSRSVENLSQCGPHLIEDDDETEHHGPLHTIKDEQCVFTLKRDYNVISEYDLTTCHNKLRRINHHL